ncbi:hypothetical protein [Rossellomorea marisflavi]|uniref:hypothetical protein n=1 Tax=Rossellomorea marisflavi TaxID=189381 RepID=UPI0034590E19
MKQTENKQTGRAAVHPVFFLSIEIERNKGTHPSNNHPPKKKGGEMNIRHSDNYMLITRTNCLAAEVG